MSPGTQKDKNKMEAITKKLELVKQAATEIVKRIDSLSEVQEPKIKEILSLGTIDYIGYLSSSLSARITQAENEIKERLAINNNDEIPF
jgi:hypothetical protein